MNSAVNPPASVAGNQVSKTMHPQGTTASYSEPSHMPQGLGIMHTNTNVAHSHPSQQHQFSLNVLNTAGHYINQNMGQIPASNHPVANPSSTAAGQGYNPQKNVSNFMSNYEENLTHQSNQNTCPPVTQALPSSVSSQPNVTVAKTTENLEQQQSDKPQSNGTSEVKSSQKMENTPSFFITSKEKSLQPAPVPQLSQVQEKTPEKTTLVSTIPSEVPQLKTSETSPKVQASTPPVTNSKPIPTVSSDPQPTETSGATISALSTHLKNTDKPASTTVDLSIREPEHKKTKVEENVTSAEQPENLKKNKPTESNKETKIENNEPPQKVEPAISNEEKTTSKEKNPKEDFSPAKQIPAITVTPTESSTTKSPTRKAKHQTPKLDESSKTPKEPKTVQKFPSISKAKRQRIRTQPYQSPLPEVELISKISSLIPRTPKSNDERLIVFYKNEFLAVRNAEGSFYLCQAVQNIYKSSSKIKIRWLSQDKNDKSGETYIPDFYDLTDFDCILTNLSLNRIDKRTFRLPPSEKERTQSILNRSLAVEKGEVTSPSLTEEHPDGLDLSLYRDEDQLKKRRGKKRKAGRKLTNVSVAVTETPTKKSPEAPKVRKVSPPAKTPAKNVAVKKTIQPVKKPTQPEIKKSASSSKRASGRGKRKTDNKTSPVVDQKKAKVLAKIGKKTAVPAAKSVQSTTKNAKSETKSTASSKKASQTKTSSSASVKPSPRHSRRSARK